MKKWLLVDGFNMAFRNFYAIPDLTRSDGFPTGALHGWLRTFWKLEDLEKPEKIAVFFDLGGSTDRLAVLPTYKAHRSDMPEALKAQIPKLKELTQLLGYSLVEERGIEADDLIASAASQLSQKEIFVSIVSSDKDFAQLLNPAINQLLPPPTANPKLGWRTLTHDQVPEKFGVSTTQIIDYLSLIGDTSDNIEGLPGVGPKTAQKWILEYGSIEKIIEKANYIEPKRFQLVIPHHIKALKRNQKIIALNKTLPLPTLNDHTLQAEKLIHFLQSMEMRTAEKEALKRYNIL